MNSPEAGTITELCAATGDTVSVGGELFKVEPGTLVDSKPAEPKVEPVKAAPKAAAPQAPPKPLAAPKAPVVEKPVQPAPTPVSVASGDNFPGYTLGLRTERRVPWVNLGQNE